MRTTSATCSDDEHCLPPRRGHSKPGRHLDEAQPASQVLPLSAAHAILVLKNARCSGTARPPPVHNCESHRRFIAPPCRRRTSPTRRLFAAVARISHACLHALCPRAARASTATHVGAFGLCLHSNGMYRWFSLCRQRSKPTLRTGINSITRRGAHYI